MRLARYYFQLVLITATLGLNWAYADDIQDITQLVTDLYAEDVAKLACMDTRGERDEELVVVSEKYISFGFMKYYRQNCVGHSIYLGDPRTGEQGIHFYDNSQAKFTNLNIEKPKIAGKLAHIRTTYDLPEASYERFGNFTLFTLIKENGKWKIDDIELGGHDYDHNGLYSEREEMGLQAIKSLKKHIKKGLAGAEAEKKASK